jgi:hypothetical protein
VSDIAEGVQAEGQRELYGCITRWCGCQIGTLFLV